jgi:hypothetical protein
MRERQAHSSDSSSMSREAGTSGRKISQMRLLTLTLSILLAAFSLGAKPRVEVSVKISDEIAKDVPQASLSRDGSSTINTSIYGLIFYFNVTVFSKNEDAVAKNDGQWCITGDTQMDKGAEYQGTLSGNNLEIEIPQKNGKTKKKSYDVIDRKWRKLSDL